MTGRHTSGSVAAGSSAGHVLKAAIGVGVPLLAALVAMLVTRSRLPMVRRIE